MTVGVGYLTSFDGTTLVDHSTKRAVKFADVSYIVRDNVFVQPIGVKTNYDGTADSTVVPERASQLIYVTTGGGAFFATLAGKLGNYATNLTHVNVASSSTTATAIMTACRRVGPRDVNPNAVMMIYVEFNLITDFS